MPLIHRRAEPEVAEAPPPPIEFSSTGIWDWDGNDGNWSMIGIDVGSPSQQMSVLVSTSYKHLSLPLAPASEHTRTDHVIFQPNRSLTWIGQNSSSGFDVVSNVSENGSEEIVGNCSIFGMPTNDHTPWRGSLGLLPEPTNGNGFYFARPQQANVTILQSFKNKGSIPSLSFGYTAGAWYSKSSLLAHDGGPNSNPGNATTSLVLGGYDAAKIIYHDSSFRVSSYKNGTFLRLNLMSISLDASQSSRSVLPNPIVVSLDTSTPFLSMPRDVCEEFVSAFDLKFDESTGLYLVNSSTHSRLQAANSSLQLSLRGRGGSEGEVKIVLPYKSLDFVAYPPIYDQPTQYFPLKLVENGELAVLGRVFFQEAYVQPFQHLLFPRGSPFPLDPEAHTTLGT